MLEGRGTDARLELEALLGYARAPRDARAGGSRLAAPGVVARSPRALNACVERLLSQRIACHPRRRNHRVAIRRIDRCRVAALGSHPRSCLREDGRCWTACNGSGVRAADRRRVGSCRCRARELWRQHRARATSRTRCARPGPTRRRSSTSSRRSSGSRSSIGLGVSSAMTIFVALRFREKPGEERSPVQTHGNTVLEVSWTIIPALILAVMAVPTVATIFNLAKKPKGPDVVHVTVDGAAVVVAVHVHRQGQRVRTPPTRCTSRSTSRCTSCRLTACTTPANNVSSTRSGSRSSPARRTSFPATPIPQASRRPARHVPRPVRRVLRPLAREHAPARDRADPDRLRRVGRRARRRRAPPADVLEGDQRHRGQVGLSRRCHCSRRPRTSARRSAPNLTHARRPRGVRGRHLPDEPRQPLEVGLRRARPQAAWATSSGWMPNFSRRTA